MHSTNSYSDPLRAAAYARLEFPNTYYLAFRDLPRIISEHVTGNRTLDFGCGTGRSTRFLRQWGFAATGVDISEDMIKKAREMDPPGDYRLIKDDDFRQFGAAAYDLILCAFTFDNIHTSEKRSGYSKNWEAC